MFDISVRNLPNVSPDSPCVHWKGISFFKPIEVTGKIAFAQINRSPFDTNLNYELLEVNLNLNSTGNFFPLGNLG